MSAGTEPATRAGAIVTSNAESLSGIVIHQLKKKGAPIISGGNSMLMDLLTAICSYGAPEFHLTIAAYTDLYHYYGIPVWGFAGCSDAHMVDQQAAIEACFSILINALAGTNLIHDVGYLSSGLTGSLEMMVMSDEIIAMARRLLRGVCTDENSLAVEAIDRVGPGGNYLSDDHTLNCFKSEFWRPTILNRLDLEQWKAAGRKAMGEKLRQRVIEIIETHKPHGLSDIVRKRIETIVAKAKTQKSASSQAGK